jgi:hypothetical protein
MGKFLRPIFNNIPEELRKLNQWVLFRVEIRKDKEGKDEETKPPYKPNGKHAASTDPSTWSTFDAVKKALDRFDGIGFVLTKDDSYVGIDFDDCRDPASGLINPDIESAIKTFQTYTEISPSGRGLRLLLRGNLPVDGRKRGDIEVYQAKRYLTITGHKLNGFPVSIEARQTELETFYKTAFPEKPEDAKQASKRTHLISQPLNRDWQNRLQIAFGSKNGDKIKKLYDGDWSDHPSQSEGDMALCAHLAFYLSGDPGAMDQAFRGTGLFRPKWDQQHGEKTYGQMTIDKAIQSCKEFYQEPSAKPFNVVNNDTRVTPDRTGKTISPENEPEGEPEIKTDTLPFPDDIMSGLAGCFANLFSTYLEPPKHFFYISYLTCLGSFIPVSLESELRMQPRIYALLLGQSADDRKSTAITKTVDFFHHALTEFIVCYGVGSAEGLQKRLKDSSKLLLCLDEFKQFISKCKIDGSVLLPFVNTLFESNRYEAQTKIVSIDLENVHLSLMAASTLATYERTWDASFTDIGFNNRLFIVPGSGDRRFSFPKKIPDTEKHFLQRDLGKLLQFVGSGLEIGINQEGRALYDQWYLDHDRSIHSKRLDVYALRFMLLLATTEFKKEIDRDIVEKVIKLMNWQLAVRQLHDPIDADSKMAAMEERIRRILKTGAQTDRELQRRTHAARAGSWFYTTAIRNLQAGDQIRMDIKSKKWRLL